MKLQSIQIGKKINTINYAVLAACVLLMVTILGGYSFVLHLIQDNAIHYVSFIGLMVTMALTTFIFNWNRKQPQSQYAIMQVLDVDATGTKASRVKVQYRDGTYGEKTFAA